MLLFGYNSGDIISILYTNIFLLKNLEFKNVSSLQIRISYKILLFRIYLNPFIVALNIYLSIFMYFPFFKRESKLILKFNQVYNFKSQDFPILCILLFFFFSFSLVVLLCTIVCYCLLFTKELYVRQKKKKKHIYRLFTTNPIFLNDAWRKKYTFRE